MGGERHHEEPVKEGGRALSIIGQLPSKNAGRLGFVK